MNRWLRVARGITALMVFMMAYFAIDALNEGAYVMAGVSAALCWLNADSFKKLTLRIDKLENP